MVLTAEHREEEELLTGLIVIMILSLICNAIALSEQILRSVTDLFQSSFKAKQFEFSTMGLIAHRYVAS